MTTNTTPPNTSFSDDEEEVTFDQTPANRSSAPGVGSPLSTTPDCAFVEKPKPVGLRDAYVHEIKKLTQRDGRESIIVSLQIADPDFPVTEANKPIDLWLAVDDPSKAEAVAKVLGLTLDDLTTEAGRAKGKQVYCRVFVSSWQGKVQVARFAPNFTKRTANDDAYWKHIDSLGITEAQYKELTKNYCGIIAPR